MNDVARIERQAPPVPFDQQMKLAQSFANSGLFGVKTADQALALMALCEAEGMHPAIAIRDYHIIQGKPALKADAMMARFQAAGGRVKWITMTDECVSAEFYHPAGGTVTIDWDSERAKKAGFWGKDNWKKFPRAMLRSRVVSEGIRAVFPGVVAGVYTPEEMQDMGDQPTAQAVESRPAREPYSNERMDKNIDGFREAINGGRNPEEVIAMIESKYTLTEQQRQQIHNLAAIDAEEATE